MKAKIETVTPEVARDLLKNNTHNRRVRQSHVDYLAAEIANGRWGITGESIKISEDGVIMDGQHRLLAVAQSGCAIDTLVVRGLPLDVQDRIDLLTPRTVADNLQLNDGLTRANQVVSAIRAIVSISCYYQNPKISTGLARMVLAEYQRDIDAVINAVAHFRPGMKGWVIGSLAFALHADRAVLPFVEAFGTGENISRGDPAKAARDWLMNGSDRSQALRGIHGYRKPAVEGLLNAAYNHVFKNQLVTIKRGAQGADYFTGRNRKSVATIREQMKHVIDTNT